MICTVDINDFSQFLRTKLRLGEATAVRRIYSLKIFLKTLDNSEITTKTIETFLWNLQQVGHRNSTLNGYLDMLLSLEKYLVERYSYAPFMKGFKRFKEDEVFVDPLTDEEIEKLLSTRIGGKNEQVYQDLTTFISYTGCRLNEALSLHCEYVDFIEKKVVFTKTKAKTVRKVFFITHLEEVLRRCAKGKKKDELVFTTPRGCKVFQPDYNKYLHQLQEKSGITKSVHPHVLRHSYATAAYDDRGDIYLVKEIMGHKDIQSTLRYTHMSNKRVRDGQLNHPFNEKYLDPKKIIETVEKETREKLLKKFDPQVVSEAVYAMTQRLYKDLSSHPSQKYAPVTSP